MDRYLKPVDNLLNKVTMYRLMLYYLSVLYSFTIIFSFFKLLPYNWFDLLASGMYVIGICYFANQVISRFFKVKPNYESQLITGTILALIVGPLPLFSNFLFLSVLGIIAMLSKYLVSYKKQHIFNPVAFAAVATALVMGQGASWWIGDGVMLPLIVLGGVIMARKLRRFHLILSFLISYTLFLIFFNFGSFNIGNLLTSISGLIFSPVILFFTFVMLTEPITSPANRKMRVFFGIFTGFVYVIYTVFLSSIFYSLELSLLTSNLIFRVISFTEKINLVLREKKEIANSIWEFIFEPTKSFDFVPGQYLEWSLPHPHADSRGNRRYFTIASSPTEKEVRLAVKIPEESSSFKRALKSLKPGDAIYATSLEGEFVLEKEKAAKYAFVAGGIGITPYVSILNYILDKNVSIDAILFYIAKSKEEFAFTELLKKAEKNGIKIIYLTERLNEDLIRKHVPDFKSRIFYLSGPQPMVTNYEDILYKMGTKYKMDFFPGYDDQ